MRRFGLLTANTGRRGFPTEQPKSGLPESQTAHAAKQWVPLLSPLPESVKFRLSGRLNCR